MPVRIENFINQGVYHVMNRGGKTIFYQDTDYQKFYGLLKRLARNKVEVIVYGLVPSHFHLLVRQLADDGLVKFVTNLQVVYAKYFNKKYHKTGVVFRSRFVAVKIKNFEQFYTVISYILKNPVKHKLIGMGMDGLASSLGLYFPRKNR